MNDQEVYDNINYLLDVVKKTNSKKVFLVCSDRNIEKFQQLLVEAEVDFVFFTEVKPNPIYEDILKALTIFKVNQCDTIISIGGGSIIDTSKVIKYYSNMNDNEEYFEQSYIPSTVIHIAIPTTAGTGSESTMFAVMYYNGEKYSISHSDLRPEYVILDSSFLDTIPDYQRKSTLLDALCQAIESYWSINSNNQSQKYSKQAIQMILNYYKEYLNKNKTVYNQIMLASNLAGRAINITKTTAPHAMSYKLSSLYGIAHGHAVALVLPQVWEYMINNLEKCVDSRGQEYVQNVFEKLNEIFNSASSENTIEIVRRIFESMELETPSYSDNELDSLVSSINAERLKNNPIGLDEQAINTIYKKSLRRQQEE